MKNKHIVIFASAILVAAAIASNGTADTNTNTPEAVRVELDLMIRLQCKTRIANIAKCNMIIEKLDRNDYKGAKDLLLVWMRSDLKMSNLDSRCPLSEDDKRALARAENYLQRK